MIVDTDKLATGKGCADALGVSTSTVANWRKRVDTFPEPVAVISGTTPVWILEDVLTWAHTHGYPGQVRTPGYSEELQRDIAARYRGGETVASIAASLNISPVSARKLISRILQRYL